VKNSVFLSGVKMSKCQNVKMSKCQKVKSAWESGKSGFFGKVRFWVIFEVFGDFGFFEVFGDFGVFSGFNGFNEFE
jgi:hypothetical protein